MKYVKDDPNSFKYYTKSFDILSIDFLETEDYQQLFLPPMVYKYYMDTNIFVSYADLSKDDEVGATFYFEQDLYLIEAVKD